MGREVTKYSEVQEIRRGLVQTVPGREGNQRVPARPQEKEKTRERRSMPPLSPRMAFLSLCAAARYAV